MQVTQPLMDSASEIYSFEWFEEQGGSCPWMFTAKDVSGDTVFSAYSISDLELKFLKDLFGIKEAHAFTRYSAYR